MKLSVIKKLSSTDCRTRYDRGELTRFEVMFRDYLTGEIDWPEYTANDIVALRNKLNLTQEALALLLKVSPKTVMRWENEGEEIPRTACLALCAVSKLGNAVFDLMNPNVSQFSLIATSDPVDICMNDLAESSRWSLSAQQTILQAPDPFDKQAVAVLRARLNLTRREFAKLLDVSQSTSDKWESGAVIPKGPALTVLKILWVKGISALKTEK